MLDDMESYLAQGSVAVLEGSALGDGAAGDSVGTAESARGSEVTAVTYSERLDRVVLEAKRRSCKRPGGTVDSATESLAPSEAGGDAGGAVKGDAGGDAEGDVVGAAAEAASAGVFLFTVTF